MKHFTEVLTAALMLAAMTLAMGCSKSDDEPAPQYKLTKDNIVGVWRSGDYWVSFSSDGYMSAYLSDKCIAEGDYTIDGDTVKVTDGIWRTDTWDEMTKTRFEVRSIGASSLTATATFNDLSILYDAGDEIVHATSQRYSFTKSQEHPCKRNNDLIGKNCIMSINTWHYDYTGFPPFRPIQITATCSIDIANRNSMTVKIFPDEGKESYEGEVYEIIEYDYVYLPPYIYMIALDYGGIFESDRSIKIYETAVLDDGSLIIPYTYPDNIEKYF